MIPNTNKADTRTGKRIKTVIREGLGGVQGCRTFSLSTASNLGGQWGAMILYQ